MDGSRFDTLTRALATGRTRRRFLGGLAAGVLGLAGHAGADAQQCRVAGKLCTKNANCCSGSCDTANPDPSKRNRCVCPAGTETCRGACCGDGEACRGGTCWQVCTGRAACGLCDPISGQCSTADTVGLACPVGSWVHARCPPIGTGPAVARCCTPGVDCINDPGGPFCSACTPPDEPVNYVLYAVHTDEEGWFVEDLCMP